MRTLCAVGHKKNLRLADHEITDALGIDDLGLTYCGILDIP